MKKFLVMIALLTFVACPTCVMASNTSTLDNFITNLLKRPPPPPIQRLGPLLTDKDMALRIEDANSICSATIVAPRVILSAAHCFYNSGQQIKLNGNWVTLDRIVQDGNDHALASLKLNGPDLISLTVFGKPTVQGDNIHYWGNADGLPMFYRKGYHTGDYDVDVMYDVNGYGGDSGSGVFNDKKELVGVVSYSYTHDAFSLMASFPFNFKRKQLRAVGMPMNKLLMTGKVANVTKINH